MRLLLRWFVFPLFLLCASAWGQTDETIHTKVDESPVPIKTPPPKFPETMRREGISGVVAVSIVIDEKGSVVTATISKASHIDFERPALEAVKAWKFKPAKKDGAVVKVRVTVPLRFNVDDN